MAYPLDDLPVAKPCPHCSASNYLWRVECSACHQRLQPALLSSGPIVLAALNDSVDDLPPGPNAKAYTLKVGRRGDVPARDWDAGYLDRWRADLLAGEASYGLGVDTLACQYPYIYGAARLRGSRVG